MPLQFSTFTFLPILVCAIAFMMIGGLWYGPLFGKPWMALTGVTMEQAQATPKNVMTRMYLGSFVAALVASYVLALLIDATLTVTLAGGAMMGFTVALGLVGGAYASGYLFNQKPLQLYIIDVGYQVTCLTIAGAILGSWQ